MTYIGEDGNEHRPYMIHRALLGSIERFFGILLEHHGGALPLWLSPVQAVVIPIADRHNDFAFQLQAKLVQSELRIDVDDSNERMGNKIRKAQLQKIPYMLIAGDREIESNQVAIRRRGGEDLGTMNLDDVEKLLSNEKINRA